MPEEHLTTESEPEALKPPRVALIASRKTVCDYPLYLKYLLVGLADESVPVMLICPPACNVDSIVPPTVEVVRHPAIDIPLLERFNRRVLLDRLDAFRPDLLHCLCETNASLARWLSGNLNLRYLLNLNSIVTRFHHVSISLTRCKAVVVPAKTIADHFASTHPKFADRIRQINIGTFVDDSTACFSHPERSPGIVVSGAPDAPDAFDNLFNALHRLAIDNYQFIVAVVDAGPAEKHLRKQLSSLGLSRVVTIVPRLPGLDNALSATDIFIVPRPSVNFNSLLLSAMSFGCAVAACTGDVDDLIIEGQTAVVFNPDEQLSIYNCLRRLFDTPELAKQIAANAQQHLRQNHHVSDMVGSTLQLYRQSAHPGQAPSPQPAPDDGRQTAEDGRTVP